MHHTPQASQRAQQVEVWAVLRTLGRQGVTDLITRTCDHAQTMATRLRRAGLQILNNVVLNQMLMRADTDDQTLALVQAVQQDGTCWCGPTVWQDRPAMRISISGWPPPATTSARAPMPSSPPRTGWTRNDKAGNAMNHAAAGEPPRLAENARDSAGRAYWRAGQDTAALRP